MLSSLHEALQFHSQKRPDEVAFVFLANGEDPDKPMTYRELDQAARSRAAAILSDSARDARVILACPPGLEFVRALLGCMYAGVVAVPVQVPSRLQSLERLRKIADDAGTSMVFTPAETRDDLLESFGDSPLLDGLTLISTDVPAAPPLPSPRPSDLALLQYTSGSTGDPKGVMITHANFISNVLETDRTWPFRSDATFVSWLPHIHDMGMMFGIVAPLYAGAPSYLMTPQSFIRRPGRWLEAISRFRGTHAAAPSFGYELCVTDACRNGIGDLDLSSWQAAGNGAEPVRWTVIQSFIQTFRPAGFRARAMSPGYGLAENTLKVTASPHDREPAALWVCPLALGEGRVKALDEKSESAVPLVGCGVSVAGTEVRVVDPVTRMPCPPDSVGEIWISGPCVARGYWGRSAETREVFHARIEGQAGEFLRTGDLGFLYQGELYISGRLKDLIIRNGRNFYPHDIEMSVEAADGGLHPNCAAAFSVDDGTVERLIVVVEASGSVLRITGAQTLVKRVCESVYDRQRLIVDDVVLVRRGAIPRTSSGKVQRRACRKQYLNDSLNSTALAGRKA